MKHLILAAALTLVAAPAFAADTQGASATQQTAMTTTAPQQHSYSYSSDTGSRSNIEIRNERLHRSAMGRSDNAKAAWSGQAHFY
jgi:hypothetical protein